MWPDSTDYTEACMQWGIGSFPGKGGGWPRYSPLDLMPSSATGLLPLSG